MPYFSHSSRVILRGTPRSSSFQFGQVLLGLKTFLLVLSILSKHLISEYFFFTHAPRHLWVFSFGWGRKYRFPTGQLRAFCTIFHDLLMNKGGAEIGQTSSAFLHSYYLILLDNIHWIGGLLSSRCGLRDCRRSIIHL